MHAEALRWLSLLLIPFFGMGCASFESHWNRTASAQPRSNDITGAWEGSWISNHNQHTGRLRAVISQKEPNLYEAWFKATYWKIFRFSYKVDLHTIQEGETFQFDGKEDLGWWAGGAYEYHGHATPKEFHSSYESAHDQGEFHMTRPSAE